MQNEEFLINIAAEKCFGHITDEHYHSFYKDLTADEKEVADLAEGMYLVAIIHGLTYEISSNGGPECEKIWAKVKKEIPELG